MAVPAQAVEEEVGSEVREEVTKEKIKKPGVIYLSRIPPYMKPEKIRSLMCQFGDVGRVYLTPEDKTDFKRRRKETGKRQQMYIDGWVEFLSRKIAKRVAESLNGTTIGGKKRHNFYRDDTWCLKYLAKFKWDHIKEEAHYNKSVRKTRLDQALSQARRENEQYLENVDNAKVRQRIEAKRAKKRGNPDQNGNDGEREDKRPRFAEKREGKAPAACSPALLSKLFG